VAGMDMLVLGEGQGSGTCIKCGRGNVASEISYGGLWAEKVCVFRKDRRRGGMGI
jgi:hypothetical protein